MACFGDFLQIPREFLGAYWFGCELLVIDSEILVLFENKNNDAYMTLQHIETNIFIIDTIKIHFSLKLD